MSKQICPLFEKDKVLESKKLLEFLHFELAAKEVLNSDKGEQKSQIYF